MSTNFIFNLKGLTITLVLTLLFTPSPGATDTYLPCIDRLDLVKESKHNITTIDLAIDPILIDAIMRVESNNGRVVYGDLHLGQPSVGVLQIRPIMVDDVNRILRIQGIDRTFTYKDRYSKDKSIEMFIIYVSYYATEDLDNHEYIARIWNGGPDGYYQNATKQYWYKVNKTLALLHR